MDVEKKLKQNIYTNTLEAIRGGQDQQELQKWLDNMGCGKDQAKDHNSGITGKLDGT